MLRSRETQFKQKNMTNVACFHSQHFSCLEGIVFKIPLALFAFAITLKGIKGNQRTKENQYTILQVQREMLS